MAGLGRNNFAKLSGLVKEYEQSNIHHSNIDLRDKYSRCRSRRDSSPL